MSIFGRKQEICSLKSFELSGYSLRDQMALPAMPREGIFRIRNIFILLKGIKYAGSGKIDTFITCLS